MKILLLALLIPFSTSALETDNYIVWGQELKDSSSHINEFFGENIELALQNIPEHESKSCEQMTKAIARDFASYLVHDNPVENWLFKRLTLQEMYPENINYVQGSIYREPYLFYIPWFGLAPNIQVNGYYFGTDKLSHFASTGMIYYKIFRKELAKGSTDEEAVKAAIRWGIRDEKTVHGFWASGVFSYADLESNYQGFLFYRKFCEGKKPYLKQNSQGEWELSVKPEIKDFINGFWDETFELSYRVPENWEKVSRVIKKRYCELKNFVQPRFTYYKRTSSRSFSRQYLDGLSTVPTPQSTAELCSSHSASAFSQISP